MASPTCSSYSQRLPVGSGPVIGGAIFLSIGGSTGTVIGWVGISFGFLSFVFWGLLYYISPGRSWRTMAANGPKTLEINDERCPNPHRRQRHHSPLECVSELIEIDEMFLLRLGMRNTYTFVPKRAFRSPSDEVTFRSLSGQGITSHNQDV